MPYTPHRFLLTVVALLAAQPAHAQLDYYYNPMRSPTEVVFLGRALPDTVWVGTGPTKPNGRNARPVYGQRFEVLQVGSHWRHLVSLKTPVVIVRWSTGSDTEPGGIYYRTGSARFVTPGRVAVYSGAIRPRTAEAEQETVLDAVSMRPYDGTFELTTYMDSTARRLTPTEFLELMEALPRSDSISIDPISSSNALRAWAAAHPELAVANPAVEYLRMTRYLIWEVRYHRTPSPVAGTYRVEVELPWNERLTYFARTEGSATNAPEGVRDRGDSSSHSGPPWHHSLIATHAATEDGLPDQYEGPDRFEPWFHSVTLDPIIRLRDSVVWRGEVDGLQVAASMERDSTRRARLRELLIRSEKERSDVWYWMPGVWILKPGEPIRFEWTVRNEKEVFYTVTAVQVSERALTP